MNSIPIKGLRLCGIPRLVSYVWLCAAKQCRNGGYCDLFMPTKILLHKASAWGHEREWRLTCSCNSAEFNQQEFSCAKKKPTAVYLGRKINPIHERYFGISLWRKTFLFIKCRSGKMSLHINFIRKYVHSLFPQAMSQNPKGLDSLPQGLDLDSMLAFSKQCWTAAIIRCPLLCYSISLS